MGDGRQNNAPTPLSGGPVPANSAPPSTGAPVPQLSPAAYKGGTIGSVTIHSGQPARKSYSSRWALLIFIGTLLAFALVGFGVWIASLIAHGVQSNLGSISSQDPASNYNVTRLSLANVPLLSQLQNINSQLLVNGQLRVANGVVLKPSASPPSAPQVGELYYDSVGNQPYYYDGNNFIALKASTGKNGSNGINGAKGDKGDIGAMGPAGASGATGNNIQNQNVAVQVADFLINGSGTAGILNATSQLQLGGVNINTTGALNNVAYLTQSNVFTNPNTFSNSVLTPALDTPSTTPLNIGASHANAINLDQNTTIATNKSLTVNGPASFAAATNSTTAFRVQNASGGNVLTVDTVNNAIIFGNDGAPVGFTIRGGVAAGTNAVGSDLTFDASNGTGTGGSGSLIFRTAAPDILVQTDDGNDSSGFANTVTSFSFAHTTANNPNRILIVGITTGCGFFGSCPGPVSSVTYGGVGLTKLTAQDCPTGQAHCRTELWYLVGPTVGTSNVVITTSGTTDITAGASSYYNVDQTVPFGASGVRSGTQGNTSVTVNGTVSDQAVVEVSCTDNVIDNTSSSEVLAWHNNNCSSGHMSALAGSTTTSGWYTFGSNWAAAAVALNPPAGSSANELANRLDITASGDIGIGTASPESLLAVNGNLAVGAYAGTNAAPSNGAIISGNVGIGTNNPGSSVLAVQGGVNDMVTLTSTFDTGFIRPLEVLDASMTAGHNLVYHVGHDLSSNDSGYFGFNYQGANSANNFITMGLWGNDNIFNITGGGNVGIGDTGPSNKLKVVGSLCVKSSAGACAGTTSGTIYATNTTVQSADVAENYVSSQTLQPGDIVMPAGDGDNQAVVKSTGSYQAQAIGIVSTQPGVTLNSDAQTNAQHPRLYPIALNGRVPVKVSTQNGPITAGDYLTASSIPGVAMKAMQAGQMVGKALENYDNPNPNAVGSVMAFVSIAWADPNLPASSSPLFKNAIDSMTAFQIQSSQGASLLTADTTNMSITVANLKVAGTLLLDGHIVTGGDTPTIAAGMAACTNPSVAVTGNDSSGTVTISTGVGCTAPGQLATIIFAVPYSRTPHIQLTPGTAQTAALQFYRTATASSFGVSAGVAPAANTTYIFDYFIAQ